MDLNEGFEWFANNGFGDNENVGGNEVMPVTVVQVSFSQLCYLLYILKLQGTSITSKMKEIMVVNNFQYRKHKVLAHGTIQKWLCVKKHCNGSAKTAFGSSENPLLLNSHTCISSPNVLAVIFFVQNIILSLFSSVEKPYAE